MNIEAEATAIGSDVEIADGVSIRCRRLTLGDGVQIRGGTSIWLYGDLHIGPLGFLGHGCSIRGNNVHIGRELYCSGGLDVGGGGWRGRHANLHIGDYCVIHNNRLNVNREITLGTHVGLSPDVAIITHGYWNSVLEGFPYTEGPVAIGDGAIIGLGATLLPGVTLGKDVVVGAGAVVSKDFPDDCVLGGVPAKVISPSTRRKLSERDRRHLFEQIVDEYRDSLAFRGLTLEIDASYPTVAFDGAIFDLIRKRAEIPNHTEYTDDFRDFVRRRGIWFHGRRFTSIP